MKRKKGCRIIGIIIKLLFITQRSERQILEGEEKEKEKENKSDE